MKYFSYAKEPLGCPCGCNAKLSKSTEDSLDRLRENYGKPIYIEQGGTCEKYSVEHVGRKPTSTHIDKGNGATAVDIQHRTFEDKDDYFHFIGCVYDAGFKGFGQGIGNFDIHKKDTRVHIDKRPGNDIVTWIYYDKE